MTVTHNNTGLSATEDARRSALIAVGRVANKLYLNDINGSTLIDHGGGQGGRGFIRFKGAIDLVQKSLTEEKYQHFCREMNDSRSVEIPFAPYGHVQEKVPKDLDIDFDEFVLTFAGVLGQ